MSQKISPREQYKHDTGEYPLETTERLFTCWRSKGQWVIDIDDEERLRLFGRQSEIEVKFFSDDYIRWLEEKLEELMDKQI